MTKITAEIKNFSRAMDKITTAMIGSEQGISKGLLAGGFLVQRRAQKRTPVEHGLLRASAFTRFAQGGGMAVEVGFSAKYAAAVHAKTEEKLRGQPRPSGLGTYWNPGESEFLTKAYAESLQDVIRLVRQYARAGMKT